MATTRIKNIASTNTNPQDGQYLAIDGASATSKINYTDLKKGIIGNTPMGTSAATVTGAIAELNEEQSASVTFTLSGVSSTKTIYKYGHIGLINCSLGNDTAFSSATGSNTLGTLPVGFRPPSTIQCAAIGRTSGTWASATFYILHLEIGTEGTVMLRGNQTNIRACKYITISTAYVIA